MNASRTLQHYASLFQSYIFINTQLYKDKQRGGEAQTERQVQTESERRT